MATLALGLAGCSLLVPETRVPMPAEPVAEDDVDRRIWLGLREILTSDMPVLLAYGTDDDLAPGHELACEGGTSGLEAGAVEQPR